MLDRVLQHKLFARVVHGLLKLGADGVKLAVGRGLQAFGVGFGAAKPFARAVLPLARLLALGLPAGLDPALLPAVCWFGG
jgi:hypothetical protein